MITPYNILRHELIGLEVKIVDATHPGYKCSGVILDETRNTIKLKDIKGKIKTLPKDCIEFVLTLPLGSQVKVDGKLFLNRPEDRIKKKYRIKFV